ncbi:hypothetical protein [Litorivita sp. NS0012-18]|uniref:hypothetical protein n=1 Tax=Litorivita sp. NS0012-18 TaxID=3127655 RepID=UPI00310AA30E
MAIISILFGAVLSTVTLGVAGFGFGASWNSLALLWLCTAVFVPVLMITAHALRPPQLTRRKGDIGALSGAPTGQPAHGH